MNIQDQPLVTVYIPTYNRVELLKRAVQSVQKQTYKNLEIIIVDDCSTDGTHDYLAQLAKEDARVRYFLKEENSGACVSRNIAIDNANGEFITGLDDDDYFIKNRIEKFILEWKKKKKNCIALYSLYKFKINENKINDNLIKKIIRSKSSNRMKILVNNLVGNQIFTKTEVLKNTEGFNIDMPAWQDFEFWYRLMEGGDFYLVRDSTYVVDISHPFERITLKKIDKINQAYINFKVKHNLTKEEDFLLFGHLYDYDLDLARYFDLLKRFIIYFDYYALIKMCKKIKNNLKK